MKALAAVAVASLATVGIIQPTTSISAVPADFEAEGAIPECSALPPGEDCCVFPDSTMLQPYELEGAKWCVGDCEAQT